MAQVIAVNAVQAGSGVSTTVANLAALLATGQRPLRVGIVDACLTAPTQHLLFGLQQAAFRFTLNDHLLGRCRLAEAAHPVTIGDEGADQPTVFLVPADPDLKAVHQAQHQAYAVDKLGAEYRQLAADLAIDALLVDCEAGLPPSTLVAFAAASSALLVLALDKQHYQAAARTVAVVEQLPVAHHSLMVNLVSPSLRFDSVHAQVVQSYGWDVAATVPYCDELLALGSASLFVRRYPAHPVTELYRQVAQSMAREGQGLEISG